MIFKYLKGTAHYSLLYRGIDLELIGNTYTDWIGYLEHHKYHKSTSAYVFLLNGDVITLASKK